MQEPIIEFRDFGFQYNAQAEPTLYNINLTVRRGEKVLIVGPSGCGKSTLAHCMNGLIPFAYQGEMSGSVTLKGRETKDLSIFELSRTVGTVLQDSDSQFIGLTVAEDIAFALENDCVTDPELHDRVLRAAKAVGMENHLGHAPGRLSGGQKQRAALAGVMVDDVELLLFDEPLANLDPATGKSAIQLIDEIHGSTGAAVVIIEHRLEDALYRAVDRIVLMHRGRIVADEAPDRLLSSPLLREHGIREPLYLTALTYAGVTVTPELRPSSIRTLALGPEEKGRVLDWFRQTPAPPPAPEKPVLLRAEDICFSYEEGGKPVLKGVSLEIHRGELLAIVGTNGAGKTTFSKVLCGFETPQSGTLSFTGLDWPSLSLKERADHVGYVMQDPNQMLSKPMIYDEIALGLRTRRLPEEEIRPRVERALKVCGLWPFRNWPVSALSYGQKKRVTIASILVLEPEIIILDEPTAGQDYRHYTEIMEFLRSLNEGGTTVVMITHDMHLMLEYAPRSVVFSQGQVIADDASAAILTDPELVRQASLKETSLYDLALQCGVPDPTEFVRRFINHEREVYRS